MKKLAFRECYQAEVVGEDRVVVWSDGCRVVEGRLVALLAPFLDGRYSADEIAERLARRTNVVDVGYGFEMLREAGLIGVVRPLGGREETYWIGRARRIFRAASWARRRDTSFVVVRSFLSTEIRKWVFRARESGRRWVPIKMVGSCVWVGPVLGGKSTACGDCLVRRLGEHWPVVSASESARNEGTASTGPAKGELLPGAEEAALYLLALQSARRAEAGRRGGTRVGRGADVLLTLDLHSRRVEDHMVPRFEDCASCGGSGAGGRGAKLLAGGAGGLDQRKAGNLGVRESDAAVLARLRARVSPLTGIVTRLASFGNVRGPVHRFTATFLYPRISLHVNGVGLRRVHGRRRVVRAAVYGTSAGKGPTKGAAKLGAICEGLERYSGFYRGTERVYHASFRSLGAAAIHPNEVMLFSDGQYSGREEWNNRESGFNWVPDRFNSRKKIEWVHVESLGGGEGKYLPAALCYYGYPADRAHDFCRADSSGCAAGATWQDAALRGLYELVERDAVAIWWYNRVVRPGVEIGSFGSAYTSRLMKHYRRLGRRVWLLDITSDLGIPVFAAVSCGARSKAAGYIFGFGAGLDARRAAEHAFSEMNQFLPVGEKAARPAFVGDIAAGKWLRPGARLARQKVREYGGRASGNALDDLRTCVEILKWRRLEALVLDQTRRETGVSVVRTIVPGLRPFWARFAPGRLYDVPVELGWLRRGKSEKEMNPGHLCV
jgi:bacteriocin biosynthesis cyclodehydratase domain-containing protein